jgi:hypothetical protein
VTDQIEGDLPVDQEPIAETKEASTSLDDLISSALDKNDNPELNTGERQRDESGRFAAKNTEAKAEIAQADVTSEASTGVQPVGTQPIEAPARWSAEEKAQFSSWDRTVQEAVLARHKAMEADYTRKTQEVAEFRRHAEPIVQAVQPFSEYLNNLAQHRQVHPANLINELLRAEYTLRTSTAEGKMAALAKIAGDYGIDLSGLRTGDGTTPDPLVNHLYQRTAQYENELAELRRSTSELQNERIAQTWEQFRTEKDANGQLVRPHVDGVRHVMASLFQSGQVNSLEEAYAKAIEPYMAMQQQAAPVRQPAEVQAIREAVEKAKKAAPVRSSGSTFRGNTQAKGLDAILAKSLDSSGF